MNALTRLHRDERASISFLAVAAALCFVGLLAMVMNSNDVIKQRIRMQEVADSTALAAATWHARGLNLVSMTNVLNGKLLTMTVLVNSLNKTLPIVEKVAEAQEKAFLACSGVPVVGAFCVAMKVVVTVQKAIIKPLKKTIKKLHDNVTACNKAAWKAMQALQTTAVAISKSFPTIATVSAYEVATSNGASFGVALNGGAIGLSGTALTNAMTLPSTNDHTKTGDYCPAMKTGGPGFVMEGYKSEEGPAKLGKAIWDIAFIPFVNLFPHPIFFGFYQFYMGPGLVDCVMDDEEEEETEVSFYDLPTCRKYEAEATWTKFESKTGVVSTANWTTDDFVPWTPISDVDGDGLSEEEKDDFADLGKYPEGAIGDSDDDSTPLIRGDGYNALESEEVEEDESEDCEPGDPESGYADDGWPGSDLLFEDDDFTPYGGRSHRRNPSDPEREETGVYYHYLEKEEAESYRWSKPGEIEAGYKIANAEQRSDYTSNPLNPRPSSSEDVLVVKEGYQYTLETWVLSDAGSKSMDGEELDGYIQDQTDGEAGSTQPSEADKQANKSCKNKIKPLLLKEEENLPNRMRYIALVYLDLGTDRTPLPFWSTFFSSPPTRITAYAQAQVYNDLSEDMFTQDWRVRLEQANLLEAALGGGGDFSIENSGNLVTDQLKHVNNH